MQLPKTTEVQSLLFDRAVYTVRQAKAWAKKHKFRFGKVDSTDDYHRLRQHDPEKFQARSIRTKTFTTGLKALVGRPLAAGVAGAKKKGGAKKKAVKAGTNPLASGFKVKRTPRGAERTSKAYVPMPGEDYIYPPAETAHEQVVLGILATSTDPQKMSAIVLRATRETGEPADDFKPGLMRLSRGGWVHHNEKRDTYEYPAPGVGAKAEADEHAARELELWIVNDADLYRQQHVPIQKNLRTKMARGIYDKEKAVKLFTYLADNGARSYTAKPHGPGWPSKWHEMFNVPTRKMTARALMETFDVEARLGNYDYLLPKKYAGHKIEGGVGTEGLRVGTREQMAGDRPIARLASEHSIAGEFETADGSGAFYIEPSEVNRGWWTIHVEKHGLTMPSGKTLPYPTTIGVIDANGRIDVWSPAAYKPRGYPGAARAALESAKELLEARGLLGGASGGEVGSHGMPPDWRQVRADEFQWSPDRETDYHITNENPQGGVGLGRWQIHHFPPGARSGTRLRVRDLPGYGRDDALVRKLAPNHRGRNDIAAFVHPFDAADAAKAHRDMAGGIGSPPSGFVMTDEGGADWHPAEGYKYRIDNRYFGRGKATNRWELYYFAPGKRTGVRLRVDDLQGYAFGKGNRKLAPEIREDYARFQNASDAAEAAEVHWRAQETEVGAKAKRKKKKGRAPEAGARQSQSRKVHGAGLDEVVPELIRMEAESMGVECEDPDVSSETQDVVDLYEIAVTEAIEDIPEDWFVSTDARLALLDDDDASYDVLMTLRGEGVGIWDGRWERYMDEKNIERAEKRLKGALRKFAGDSGAGALSEAFMADAERCAGDDGNEVGYIGPLSTGLKYSMPVFAKAGRQR